VPAEIAVRTLLLLPFAAGCFTPEAPTFDVTELAYATEYTQSEGIVLRPFRYDGLLCPDGEGATAYAVYRTDIPTPMPYVVYFHGGSFDYVLDPVPEDPLFGPHYADDARLTAEWANRRVFQTLGLLEPDPTEVSLGTLPAALAEAGAFTVYPANCWGDLWHNEFGYERNAEEEYLLRNGRALAWATVALASPDADTATRWSTAFGFDDLPVDVDFSSVSLVGVSEGGRAPMEIIRRSQRVASIPGASATLPTIDGMLIDSTPDNYYPIVSDYTRFQGLNDGIRRIYPDDYSTSMGWWSMQRVLNDTGLPGQSTLQVFWSSVDPQVPNETMDGLEIIYASNPFGARFQLTDTGLPQHGYLNGDYAAARQAVQGMLGG